MSGYSLTFINVSTDVQDSDIAIFATAELPQHTLRFHNRSGKTQTLVLYQPLGDGVTGMEVAWIAVPVANDVQANVKWQPVHELIWAETGELAPGIHIGLSEIVAAALGTSSRITLGYADGAFRFHGQGPGPRDAFEIVCDPTVPLNTASIGLAMAGAACQLIQAVPGNTSMLTAWPNYWVTVADAKPGEMLDLSHVLTDKVQVTFPQDGTGMTVTLDGDMNWTVEPGLV